MHRNHARSSAHNQNCIFCGELVSMPYTHVLLRCPGWFTTRALVLETCLTNAQTSSAEKVQRQLSSAPGDLGFAQLLDWMTAVDNSANDFWARA